MDAVRFKAYLVGVEHFIYYIYLIVWGTIFVSTRPESDPAVQIYFIRLVFGSVGLNTTVLMLYGLHWYKPRLLIPAYTFTLFCGVTVLAFAVLDYERNLETTMFYVDIFANALALGTLSIIRITFQEMNASQDII